VKNNGDGDKGLVPCFRTEVTGEGLELIHPVKPAWIGLNLLFESFHSPTISLGREAEGS
jgi:hypothetical protein